MHLLTVFDQRPNSGFEHRQWYVVVSVKITKWYDFLVYHMFNLFAVSTYINTNTMHEFVLVLLLLKSVVCQSSRKILKCVCIVHGAAFLSQNIFFFCNQQLLDVLKGNWSIMASFFFFFNSNNLFYTLTFSANHFSLWYYGIMSPST